MGHHWRTSIGRPDVIHGAGDHDVEYIAGWTASITLTLATIFVVWHFGL